MSFKLGIIFVFFYSIASFGQTKYYKTKGGKIISEEKYLMLKREHFDAYFHMPKVVLNENLSEISKSTDSLVYRFNWKMKVADSPEIDINYFDEDKYLLQEFPIHSLYTIDNEIIDIKNLKGKPSLINFWFIGCKPCIEEMPVLNQLKAKFKDSVNFYSITFESMENVLKFLQKREFNYKPIVDAKEFIKEIGINSFPKNIFLDKEGRLAKVEAGVPEHSFNNGEWKLDDGKVFEAILRKLL